MQFTEMFVKSLKPKDKAYDAREKSGNGFGITVFPSGEKSFIYIYQFNARKRRMTIGKHPHCSLADARKLHREALAMLAKGKDPAAEKKKAKIVTRDASTINGLIDEYIDKWAIPNKRSWKADEQSLNKDIRPYWGKLKAQDITRRDVILLLDRIKDRGAPVQANRVLACLSKMFNFAIERDIIPSNPCAGVKRVVKEKQRERMLSEDEIRILWLALEQAISPNNSQHVIHMSEQTQLVLKFQLVTAQRKGEVVSAEWQEIDLVNGWWTIPASKAKNKQSHRVPLSSLAIEILEEVKKISGDSNFLFPADPAKSKSPFLQGSSIDHAVRRSLLNGVQPWTPHDLRRTAASHMTSIGISRLVVSKILNHSEKSVTAIYDRHSYDNEKRAALEAWAQKLKEIVYGEILEGKDK